MKLRCFISPGINKVAHYHIFVWNLFDSHFCEFAFGVLYASVLKLITIAMLLWEPVISQIVLVMVF